MAEDPYTTKKFRKVVPIAPVAPYPHALDALTRPSVSSAPPAADWDDDPPTIPGGAVAIPPPSSVVLLTRASLRVIVGVNAGQIFALDKDETIVGRGRDAHVRVDEVGISRRHACVRKAEEGRHILEDLGSTNGVFVNARRVERIDLADGDRVQIGPTLLLRFGLIAADEEALARQLYEGSTRDALTQLFNRKYASERLATEVAYAHRHGSHLAVVLFDIDHFKRVNDTFGHLAGDVVLRVVSAQAQKTVRTEDVLARYGGEEFVVIVRGIEHKNVLVLAERVRRAIERLSIPWESRALRTTVSAGVALLDQCGSQATRDQLIALADERLYQAKASGRNRVC